MGGRGGRGQLDEVVARAQAQIVEHREPLGVGAAIAHARAVGALELERDTGPARGPEHHSPGRRGIIRPDRPAIRVVGAAQVSGQPDRAGDGGRLRRGLVRLRVTRRRRRASAAHMDPVLAILGDVLLVAGQATADTQEVGAGRELDLAGNGRCPDPDVGVHSWRRDGLELDGHHPGRRGEREEPDAGVGGGHAPDGDVPRGEAVLRRDLPEEQVLVRVLHERAAKAELGGQRARDHRLVVGLRFGQAALGRRWRVHPRPRRTRRHGTGWRGGDGVRSGRWLLGRPRRREPQDTAGDDGHARPGTQGASRTRAVERHGARLGPHEAPGN